MKRTKGFALAGTGIAALALAGCGPTTASTPSASIPPRRLKPLPWGPFMPDRAATPPAPCRNTPDLSFGLIK